MHVPLSLTPGSRTTHPVSTTTCSKSKPLPDSQSLTPAPFHRFEDSNVSGLLQLKSSVQKTIKTRIVEQFPLLEGHMDDILTKKEGTRVVKCQDHIEIVVNGNGDHLFFKQRDGPYFPSLRLVHKCK